MKKDVYEEGAGTATRSRGKGDSRSSRPAPNKEEMMKKMQAAGTPGPAHEALNAFEGNWKAEVKCWMEPGNEPNVSQATSKTHWIFGRRFLEEEFHGEMMGKPFTGRCLLGFDNTKQKFNSVWIDDMGTAIFTSEGRGENANKVITLEGKASCAATGRTDVPMKQIFRVVSPDKHILEMFNDGQKSMEITYTRQ
jgi:Protein of unknown function (DUF1579)